MAALVHNRRVKHLASAAALLLAAVGMGCATAHAGSAAAGPALDAPAPPPHEVQVPAAADDPPAADAPAVPTESPAVKPQRPPARSNPAKPAKPEAVTAPPAAQPAVPPPAEVPLPLQTTTRVAEAEKRVRALLDQATANLGRTDYRALSAESKTEYDTARRFVRQAAEALKAENVSYAEQLAGKAATIAARLAPRLTPDDPTAAARPS